MINSIVVVYLLKYYNNLGLDGESGMTVRSTLRHVVSVSCDFKLTGPRISNKLFQFVVNPTMVQWSVQVILFVIVTCFEMSWNCCSPP